MNGRRVSRRRKLNKATDVSRRRCLVCGKVSSTTGIGKHSFSTGFVGSVEVEPTESR